MKELFFSPYAAKKAEVGGTEWTDAIRKANDFIWIDFESFVGVGRHGLRELKRNWAVSHIRMTKRGVERRHVGRYGSPEAAIKAARKP
jgi:hypothetical protein